MFKPIHLKEAFRMYRRNLRVKRKGVKQYSGNTKEICSQIVKDCWNKTYFQTSIGHFNEFWTRDFSWCVEPLMKLGYKNEVKKTLEYALDIFSKKHVSTTISPRRTPFDFPNYAPDSLAYLIRSLRIGHKKLIKQYKDFLNNEMAFYKNKVIDETGLVRKDTHFSSMKDHALRVSSCYDNTMVGMLAMELRKAKLDNPFKEFNYKKLIKDNFWNDFCFIDDLSGKQLVTGDANVFPYWSGLFTSRSMLKSSIDAIQSYDLDKPFPLRYYHNAASQEMIGMEFFTPNYERDTAWTHMGALYIELVKKVNKRLFRQYIVEYESIIEHYKNYLEVFNPNGSPYKSRFYFADEGMLWAAIFLRTMNY